MNKPLIQIAFITGRSSPGNVQLSPVQLAYIQQLARPGRQLVPVNFPYYVPHHSPSHQPVGLFTASINNGCDYLLSRCRRFQNKYQSAVIELLAAAQHTVFLSGSCGLELFNNLNLPHTLMRTTSLIAYGAVARQRPRCNHLLIQGDRDWISKLWFSRADEKIMSGHLDYLNSDQLLIHCERFISTIETTMARV